MDATVGFLSQCPGCGGRTHNWFIKGYADDKFGQIQNESINKSNV